MHHKLDHDGQFELKERTPGGGHVARIALELQHLIGHHNNCTVSSTHHIPLIGEIWLGFSARNE